jgi:hypothetical protein
MKTRLWKTIFAVLLLLPVCANGTTVFQEGFENAPLNQPYPWNGSNNDNWYDWAYNRAVPVSNFPEHGRDFLGNNVLYIRDGESYHLVPSQTLPVKFEYDLLFHYSEQSPSGYGAIFGQGIIVNQRGSRGDTTSLHIQKGYSYGRTGQDGIYWEENYDDNWHRIDDIISDTWYHVERIINPAEQTETIKLINRDILQEYNFIYEIITPINSIEGFTLLAAYSPSYCLLDNLNIEVIPEPATLLLLVFGIAICKRR